MFALTMSVFLVACGGGRGAANDSATDTGNAVTAETVEATPRDIATRTSGARDDCPHTGLWAKCSVVNRLRQSGFVVRPVEGEAAARPGFSVKPVVYMLGQSRLEIFIYGSEAGSAKDAAALDTVLVAPRGMPSTWESSPTFIRTANLIAVLLSQSPRQAERVALALTAGAPQPESPR